MLKKSDLCYFNSFQAKYEQKGSAIADAQISQVLCYWIYVKLYKWLKVKKHMLFCQLSQEGSTGETVRTRIVHILEVSVTVDKHFQFFTVSFWVLQLGTGKSWCSLENLVLIYWQLLYITAGLWKNGNNQHTLFLFIFKSLLMSKIIWFSLE